MRLADRLQEFLILEDVSVEQLWAPFDKMRSEAGRQTSRSAVEWAVDLLKRNNRIVWALRWLKLILFRRFDEKNLYARERDRLAHRSGRTPEEIDRAVPESLVEFRNALGHYFAPATLQSVPRIREYTFQYQTPSEVFRQFQAWEDEAAAADPAEQDRLIPDEDLFNEVVEKVYPNGWVIARLNRNECDQYGYAMRHCGRPNKPTEGGTFVVLRRPVYLRDGEIVHSPDEGDTYWYPLYFFELDGSGYYRQMKGRHNSKPLEKHHYPYIVDMLTLPYVKGTVKGNWYRSEFDFKFHDLSRELRELVLERKPDFDVDAVPIVRLRLLYEREGLSDAFFRALSEELDTNAEPYEDSTSLIRARDFPYFTVRAYCRYSGALPHEAEKIFEEPDTVSKREEKEPGTVSDYFQGSYDHLATVDRMEELVVEACRIHPDLAQRLRRWVARLARPASVEIPRDVPGLARFMVRDARAFGVTGPLLREAVAYGWGFAHRGLLSEDAVKFIVFLLYRQRGEFGFLKIHEPEAPATLDDFLNASIDWIVDMDEVISFLDEQRYDGGNAPDVVELIQSAGGLEYYDLMHVKEWSDWDEFSEYEFDQGLFRDEADRVRRHYGNFPSDTQLPLPGHDDVEPSPRFHLDRAARFLYNRLVTMQERRRSASVRHLLQLAESLR